MQRDHCLVMGVLNVTPDSFSDGGLFLTPDSALSHAAKLMEEGADIIDVGAESSRPGAAPLSLEEEWSRLEPIFNGLSASNFPVRISVDTYKPEIMRRAVDCGASVVNDIKGASPSDEILRDLASKQVTYLAMHMHKEPTTMQADPLGRQAALAAVESFLAHTHARLAALGFANDDIWLDPGIGFGKGDRGNLALLEKVPEWAKRFNLAVGVSRKSFIGRLLDIPEPKDRDNPAKMLELNLLMSGVKVLRTHSVGPVVRMRSLLRD
ncbi:MAG: dihydropteroate synthase [Oligoflexales bacterium]